MMKYIFIMMGAMFFLVTSMAMAVEDMTKTKISEKIEVRVPQLSDVKLNKLMEHIGKPVPNNFYECLCGPGRVAGGGCKYAPGNDCWCGGPLGGGGYTGFATNSHKGCIKSKTYNDGRTIVDVLSSEIIPLEDNIAGDTFTMKRLNELEEKLLLKNEKYKSLCLPTFSKNFEEYIWDGTRGDIIKKALEISESSDNICEEAISLSLFLGGQEGRSYFEIGRDLIIGYKTPNQFDVASKFAELLPLAEAVPVLNVFSKALTIKSSIELLDDEYTKSKTNKQFMDAYELFHESEHWSLKNQNLYDKLISDEIDEIDQKINKKYSKLKSEINNIYPSIKEIKVYGREYLTNTKVPNDEVIWQKFRQSKNELIKASEIEIGPLLYERAGLIMKKNVIKSYRKPLTKDGCEKFLKQRKEQCKK